jgi:drug/metabolite transporter (DMT)-like permease
VKGAALGLAAAATFGASAPVAKLLLPGFGPLALAGLLYLGAGLGLTLYRLARAGVESGSKEASLRKRDLPGLLGIVLTGGVAGPVLMLLGLERMSGLSASLLLQLEAPFTILLALALFGEHVGSRQLWSIAVVLLGGLLLSLRPGELRAEAWGAVAIAGACFSWALDNNLSQRLSLRDPIALVQVKTLGAGSLTLLVALLTGSPFGSREAIGLALLLGSVSYGLSIVLDAYALRYVGAAREAAFFATAPLVGALLAIPLLGERPTWIDCGAAALMITGISLLLRERHGHAHTHEPLEHEHLHVHDEHHQHEHAGTVSEPHSHPHRHAALTHDHPHVSDAHHRHRHS